MRPVRNRPVGVGLLGFPTAMLYVCTTSPPSITYILRSDRSTFSSRPSWTPLKRSRRSNRNRSAAIAIGTATRKSASCRLYFGRRILPRGVRVCRRMGANGVPVITYANRLLCRGGVAWDRDGRAEMRYLVPVLVYVAGRFESGLAVGIDESSGRIGWIGRAEEVAPGSADAAATGLPDPVAPASPGA